MSVIFKITSAKSYEKREEKEAMDAKWSVLAIDIVREANRIPSATLTLNDGDVAKADFLISDSDFFKPGRYIQIYFRPDEKAEDKLVFGGLVITHAWEANSNQSTLTIGLKDSVFLMTQTRKSRTLSNQSDNDTINNIIDSYEHRIPFLGEFTKSLIVNNKCKVQYNCTDWDFMMEIAESNGLLVSVIDGKIFFKAIELSGMPIQPTHVIDFLTKKNSFARNGSQC